MIISRQRMIMILGIERFSFCKRIYNIKQHIKIPVLFFCELHIPLETRRESDFIRHTSSAFRKEAISWYPFLLGSCAIRHPSSSAAAVSAFGTSGVSIFSGKGIPCSRMLVRKKRLIAVVILSPSSENKASACSFTVRSMRMFRFVVIVAMIPHLILSIKEKMCIVNT